MYGSEFSCLGRKLEVSSQLHAPATLPLGKGFLYTLDRRMGGPPSRYGQRGEEKILDPTGTNFECLASSYTDLQKQMVQT
jgi:hypothetical protein